MECDKINSETHPPTPSLSKQYREICPTHRRLVKSGSLSCSVDLDSSPPIVATPRSKTTLILPSTEGSVHWGSLTNNSGVGTPQQESTSSSSVFESEEDKVEPLDISRGRIIKNKPSVIEGSSLKRISSTDPLFLNKTIPIVDTSFSSLDSPTEVFKAPNNLRWPLSPEFEPELEADTMSISTIEQEANNLNRERRRLKREMKEYTVDDITIDTMDAVELEISRIKEKKNQYQDNIEDFVAKWSRTAYVNDTFTNQWNEEVQSIGTEVKLYVQSLRSKKSSLVPASGVNERMIAFQEASLRLQELTLKEQQEANLKRSQEKAEEARIMAETEGNLVLGECSVLMDMLMIENDWEAVDDERISQAMRSMGKWQEQMNTLERAYRQFENMATKYDFPATKKDAIFETYEEKKTLFEETRKSIKEEDTVRGLYTLEPPRSEIIKYPLFSGLPSEDYLKFKDTMEQRFRDNKVKRREQVSKLRECLKGQALGRVPDGVLDITEAFRRLNEAFGNPSKVMGHNLKLLDDLGMLPPEKVNGSQFNYAKQIEWYLKLEVILNKILELSKRSSKLAHEAFSSATYRKIWAKFPTCLIQKLVKIPGEDADRLEGIIEKIVQLREQAQLLDDECGGAVLPTEKKPASKVTAEVFFRQPKTFNECRVCTHLSATGTHSDLFVNHLSNYATGCPKFMEASPEVRKTLARKIKFCSQCFHPDIIWTPAHMKECAFNSKKNKFSCTAENCKEHMWICLTHRQKNRSSMEKFRQDMLRKGLTLAMTTHIPLQVTSAEATTAVRKIKRGQTKRGREIIPVPSGDPLFLFHATQGKTQPVNTFYDSGCSHAIFRDGIPGEQLRGQIVCKGPFQINGVGGLNTQALDEWLTCVKRSDGKIQLVQGLTVSKVTSDFPMMDLSAAVAEIKADDSSNLLLQSCSLPPMAGGTVDMLLGSKYLSVFPKQVHSLPCGLTIYKSQLASHDGKYDSCIGGPHSSFTALANLAGGTPQLIAAFIDGLQAYRQFGPPTLKSVSLTNEDIKMAQSFNFKESGLTDNHLLHDNTLINDDDLDFEPVPIGNIPIKSHTCCSTCQAISPKAIVAHDERVSDFKKSQGINESGLEIEYRCPQCRTCVECKNSDRTEKLSLREESELYQIKKSVRLDVDNKRIQCSLPLRGKERDFLSNNRNRALKTLQQQCNKYFDDSPTRAAILVAFEKLFKNGHAKLLSDLSEDELNSFINKEVQHHIPWRVVFSSSPTTPCRPVMDASTRTSFRSDGSGGKCLNDLVCKGKIETLNLVKVLLRFTVGKFALSGDLQQFYNACKLDSNMWNLQRFLWLDNLDPNGEVLEAVVTTLIYGVKCVSAQSEYALEELANLVKSKYPELAAFLVHSRYVDDLQDSKDTQQRCFDLANNADQEFEKIGLVCKGWTFTGLLPPPALTKDGVSVSVGGFSWFPQGDFLELKIPKLHFGKPKRGKIPETVKFFDEGDLTMEEFVPQKITKRQVTSKQASIFDVLGKLAPIMTKLKVDLRSTFQRTEGWDTAIDPDLRAKWVQNFTLIEKCRGLKYTRAIMPSDAVDSKMRLLTGVDAAKHGLMMGCWGGFRLRDNSWSNQLVLGRSLLASNTSIPKDELQALCGGSNMAWIVRMALKDWVDRSILFGDSRIALCWLTSEKLRLSLFHRNRVLQIRRGTELETVYHCKSEYNPADCGTRPDKISLTDIGPESRWENGDNWMNQDIELAVENGILVPATELRVSSEEEEDFSKGLIFGEDEEVLTHGHVSKQTSELRKNKITEVAAFSNYLIIPTQLKFPRLVRVYSYVIAFISKTRNGKTFQGPLLQRTDLSFSSFFCNISETDDVKSINRVFCFSIDKSTNRILTDNHVHLAMLYLFRKASSEVRHFYSKKFIEKFAFEYDGILLSKGRLLDGINFVDTGEFEDYSLESLGIKVKLPVLARYSPLSYCVGQYIHCEVAKHRGIETTNRMSLQHVSILQGMNLYREIAEDCIRCHEKRKKYFEVPMGPVSSDQLVIAPAFYVTMVDLFGPLRSFVPGFERATRNRRELESKVHILVSVCVTTRAVNLQAIEGKDASAIIDGFTRLCSEVGVPTKILVDKDAGAMSAFNSAELDIFNLQHQLHTQFGILFETCPKGGHDQHGLVESLIKSIQSIFDECGLKSKRIHALGWQSFCKLAENSINNIPIGFSYGRQQDNSELLKIITPNMLRIGRINSRALHGPIRLPVNRKELLEMVENTYKAWFNIFKETVVPRLINQPKWFRQDMDLQEQDIVYFQKDESDLSSDWKIGTIDQIVRSRDGRIRRVIIKYFNASENDPARSHYVPRWTDRSSRKIVKLWSMDEACLMDDLAEVKKKLLDHGHIEKNQEKGVNMFQFGALLDDSLLELPFAYPCEINNIRRFVADNVLENFEFETEDHSTLYSVLMSTNLILE